MYAGLSLNAYTKNDIGYSEVPNTYTTTRYFTNTIFMKHILLNIKTLIEKEKSIFFILIIGLTISSFTIVFCYGMLYQIYQSKLTELNPVDSIEYNFTNTEIDYVKWEELKSALQSLSQNVTTSVNSVTMKSSLKDTPEDDNFELFEFNFALDNSGIPQYLDLESTLTSSGLLYNGRYFTKEEFDSGAHVAIGNPYRYINLANQDIYTKQYESDSSGDTYLIDGQSFQRIGSALLWTTPMFPVTLLKDDARIAYIAFSFENFSLTKTKYDDLCNVFKSCFGNRVTYEKYTFPELDNNYYYLVTAAVIVLALFTAVILSLLYEYIFLQQKNTLGIFLLCGLSKKSTIAQFINQCILILSIVYCLAIIIFDRVFLNLTGKTWLCFREAYSIKAYLLIYLGMLISNSLIILFVCIKKIRFNHIKQIITR